MVLVENMQTENDQTRRLARTFIARLPKFSNAIMSVSLSSQHAISGPLPALPAKTLFELRFAGGSIVLFAFCLI